jgi:hypothetical protein
VVYHTDTARWFIILTQPGGLSYWHSQVVYHTDTARWFIILTQSGGLSYWHSQVTFFILTEPSDVFHTARAKWCFSYWQSRMIFFILTEPSDVFRQQEMKVEWPESRFTRCVLILCTRRSHTEKQGYISSPRVEFEPMTPCVPASK